MRSQTPIQQQRTTQTQLSRSRPHNPSLARRIQSPGQRASPLRKMQQQTRQRTRRQRQSTPLPEKRGRTRQTTHRSHANTTLQHMVTTPPPFQHKKGGARRKRKRRKKEDKTKEDKANNKKAQWCSGITCVLAWLRAHYPEHQHKKEEKERKTERQDKQRELHTHHTAAIPQPTTQYNKTTHTPQHIKS